MYVDARVVGKNPDVRIYLINDVSNKKEKMEGPSIGP